MIHILSSSHYQHLSFQISWKNNPHWLYLFSTCLHFSVYCGLVKITNNLLHAKSNGSFAGCLTHDFSAALGIAVVPLLISVLCILISIGFWDSSLHRLLLFCMFFFFISEHLGRFSPGSPLSQKIIFPLVYALPWLQLTLLCWWATIANLQPDFSSELHTGISNNRLLEVDILWTLHIHYSLSPWCFYTNRV